GLEAPRRAKTLNSSPDCVILPRSPGNRSIQEREPMPPSQNGTSRTLTPAPVEASRNGHQSGAEPNGPAPLNGHATINGSAPLNGGLQLAERQPRSLDWTPESLDEVALELEPRGPEATLEWMVEQ